MRSWTVANVFVAIVCAFCAPAATKEDYYPFRIELVTKE